jgi:HAD superfamily hydrolase (TIGR01509 family)
MMEQTKAIFWDNDGVLVDTEPLYFEANRSVLSELGIVLTLEAFKEISLCVGGSVLELARSDGRGDEEIEKLRALRNDRYTELIDERAALFPETKAVLEALEGRVRMAIVTSSNQDHFERIHAALGILHFFEFVLTGQDFTRYKPHPEPYLLAAERMGIPASECLVVEDSARGLASAVAAGIPCAVIPHPLSAGADFSAASTVLDHIGEVPNLLRRSSVPLPEHPNKRTE